VVSQTHLKEEAVISFGLEKNDPFRGPFLDPLFLQGPHANEVLDLLSNLLKRDAVYVGRLERHYEIAKAISDGTLKPENHLFDSPIPPISSVSARFSEMIGHIRCQRSDR
jgi:hypothetical protein